MLVYSITDAQRALMRSARNAARRLPGAMLRDAAAV
jgi:hypothetical protein